MAFEVVAVRMPSSVVVTVALVHLLDVFVVVLQVVYLTA
jgi:hypothetical protein